MQDREGKETPEALIEKRPWEPPRLVPLDVAATEAGIFMDGTDLDGGPPISSLA
jgi:hypothetical protein